MTTKVTKEYFGCQLEISAMSAPDYPWQTWQHVSRFYIDDDYADHFLPRSKKVNEFISEPLYHVKDKMGRWQYNIAKIGERIGAVVLTKEDVLKYTGRKNITDVIIDEMKAVIGEELNTINQYLRGEVYQIRVSRFGYTFMIFDHIYNVAVGEINVKQTIDNFIKDIDGYMYDQEILFACMEAQLENPTDDEGNVLEGKYKGWDIILPTLEKIKKFDLQENGTKVFPIGHAEISVFPWLDGSIYIEANFETPRYEVI